MQNSKLNLDNKKIYIEFLRIAAAFLVIVNHTNSRIFLGVQPSALWFSSISYFFISKIAVPVFIMIMGAVLLEKEDSIKKYFSRIIRIAVVTVVFTVFMHICFNGRASVSALIKEILNSSREPYWYLYMYLGLLFILPVMQRMAKALSRQEMLILLFATLAVGGVVPMMEFAGFKVHQAFGYGIFSPYIGMAFAGYYIEKHMDITKKKAVISGICFVLFILLQTAVSYKSYITRNGIDYLWLDNTRFITVTIPAICFYIVVRYIFDNINLSEKSKKIICYTGGLTFGIYLISDCFVALLAPLYNVVLADIPVMVAMIIYEIAVFACSALVTAIIRLIPAVKSFI